MAISDVAFIGLAAGSLTTFALLPQVIRSFRRKSTRDLSLWWIITLASGVALWLAYGILISDIPLVAANTLTIVLAVSLLAMKIRWG